MYDQRCPPFALLLLLAYLISVMSGFTVILDTVYHRWKGRVWLVYLSLMKGHGDSCGAT